MDLGKFRVATYQDVSGLSFGQGGDVAKSLTPTGELVERKVPGAQPNLSISLLDGKKAAVARVNLVNAWASLREAPDLDEDRFQRAPST
ncbi:hypothetical protein ACWD4B_12405 [Streptomyces sp. NPDC002536]